MTPDPRTSLSFWSVGLALVALLGAAGCARGADEAQLREDLQTTLDGGVEPGLFKIVGLRREGSAPLPAGESGTPRVVVYYNTTLELGRDYEPGQWEQLAPGSIAYALGATDKGIFGLKAQNRAGDLIRAYGSAAYEQTADGWTSVAAAPVQTAPAPNFEGTVPPSRSKQLIDRLAAMVELPPPGVPPQQDEIIADELARAAENIERRVGRREHVFTLASGPAGGEYARVGTAIVAAVKQLAPHVRLRERNTDGSVENVRLVAQGEADYAIVQSDVASAALAGQDPFARGETLTKLRAVGGLFPEPIHVVVLNDSPIRDIQELRGRRVNIGPSGSGTRYDAVAVLAAYGLNLQDLGRAGEDAVPGAIRGLEQKQLDAVFVTAAAPAPAIQQLASRTALRLLPVSGAAVEQLAQTRPGLTALTLPPNTYPKMKQATSTVASAALLVTTSDAPDAEVARVADLVFARMPQEGIGGPAALRIVPGHALRNVTIPLHPGAAQEVR
jgi:TRAP transporter TAXI family solute receptor